MTIELDKGPITVIVPAYKAADFIESCLDSIYSQTWLEDHGNILNVKVCVDGCVKTKEKLEKIINKYTNLEVLYCPENKGTYIALNTMLSRVETGNIIVFGADDMMQPEMIDEIMKIKKAGYVKAHGVLVAPLWLIRKHGGFMPWRCAGDTELIRRIRKRTGAHLFQYPHLFYRRHHKDQITKSEKYGHGSEIRKQYIKEIERPKPAKIKPVLNDYIVLEKKKTSFNVATYPAREKTLKKTIESVVNKVDVVRVCLNEYKKAPEWLAELGVDCVIPKENLKDKGKFIWSKEKRNEIYFTGDDDLVYTNKYFKKHLEYLNANPNSIISSHGRKLRDNAKSLMDCKQYGACLKDLPESFVGNIAGTGVMVFDLSKFTMDLDAIDCAGMVDIGIAIKAGEENRALIIRKHESKELEYLLKADDETLWRKNLAKLKKQEALLKQIKKIQLPKIKEPFENIIPEANYIPERPRRNIKPFIPKIKSYVINLPEQKQRLANFQYDEQAVTLKSIVVNPVKTSSFEVKRQHDKLVQMNAVGSEQVRAKEISNRLTFAKILKGEVEEKIIIFEDDVKFADNFRVKLNKVLYQLPDDFEICYLGMYAKREFDVEQYSNNLLRIKSGGAKIHGAHAIIYNKKVYDKISDALIKLESRITDFEIPRQCFAGGKCFIADPLICFQRKYLQTMHPNLDVDALQAKTQGIINQSIQRSLENEQRKNMA